MTEDIDTTWEAYAKAIAIANKTYDKALAIAKKTLEEATDSADKAYDEALAIADKAYNKGLQNMPKGGFETMESKTDRERIAELEELTKLICLYNEGTTDADDRRLAKIILDAGYTHQPEPPLFNDDYITGEGAGYKTGYGSGWTIGYQEGVKAGQEAERNRIVDPPEHELVGDGNDF